MNQSLKPTLSLVFLLDGVLVVVVEVSVSVSIQLLSYIFLLLADLFLFCLADCVCKTCYRQFHVPHIGLKRTCTCGDSKVESVCKMCYLNNSNVLHPIRGGFVFGQESYAKICR